jgi:hypothetical protein
MACRNSKASNVMAIHKVHAGSALVHDHRGPQSGCSDRNAEGSGTLILSQFRTKIPTPTSPNAARRLTAHQCGDTARPINEPEEIGPAVDPAEI